jgi:hypothetical protein
MPRRQLSRVNSTRPSGQVSCKLKSAGTRATIRSLPDKLTAYSERSSPTLAAVNQTSLPLGDQARPIVPPGCWVEIFLSCPARSTTATVPMVSPCKE